MHTRSCIKVMASADSTKPLALIQGDTTMASRRSEAVPLGVREVEVGKKSPLTPQQEIELSLRWREGDRRAGQEIIERCVPFVMTIALEYRRWGAPIDDLVQEGNIGLLKAAERFDPSRGCRLVTYAAYWIRAQIREYVAQCYRIVRLGSSKGERRMLRIYRRTSERDPDVLAAQTGLSRERVLSLLPVLGAHDVSLDKKNPEGDAPIDRLVSSSPSPEDQASSKEESSQVESAVRQAISELPARERKIAELRWLRETPVTLEQLGVDFGVSKERVRQLEERAKERVRVRLLDLVAV
jgi:RNA polymerase sigma-32 factor